MTGTTTSPLPLRCRAPGGGPPVPLPDLTTTSTVEELECAVRIALAYAEDKALVLLVGFPPRPITAATGTATATATATEADTDTSTHTQALTLAGLVRPNEVITVREDDGGEATVLQGQGAMKKGGGGRKKAAGAGAKPAGAAAAKAQNAGPNIHTLHGGGGTKKVRGGASAFGSAGGGGGGVRKRRRVNVGLSSEEDIGGLLLASVSAGGGGSGRAGQCMRAAFRMAIEKQYDESKADARVAAAEAGRFVIEENTAARRADGSCARIKVTYHKGIGFQSDFEDDVELLSKPQLLGVVASVLADENAREMLKPRSMAGCSPRVFWSLLHCFGGGDVEVALRLLVPTQDWGFLHERHRKLSEKALENQAQEEERRREREEVAREKREKREAKARVAAERKEMKEGGNGGGGGVGGGGGGGGEEKKKKKKTKGKKGKEKEEEDEVQVMEGGGGGGGEAALDEREVRAQAALARLTQGPPPTTAPPITAAAAASGTEEGSGSEEEEKEEEGEIDSDYPELVSDAWVRVLTSPAFNLPNCAALAAADVEALTQSIHQHHQRGGKPRAPSSPTEEEIESWILAAQADELDTVMMDIVGGDEDLLEVLEMVHMGTPADVKLWTSSPETFLRMVGEEVSEEKWGQIEGKLSMEGVMEMRRKAEGWLAEREWLGHCRSE